MTHDPAEPRPDHDIDPDDGPRPYTRDEVRTMFLDAVRKQVDAWAHAPDLIEMIPIMTPVNRQTCLRGRIEGVVKSVLALIDNGDDHLPPFMLIPDPAGRADIDERQARGENWFEIGGAWEFHDFTDDSDIAGDLHTAFLQTKPEPLWRPMSTAPNDGTKIFVTLQSPRSKRRAFKGVRFKEGKWWSTLITATIEDLGYHPEPLCWRPETEADRPFEGEMEG